MTESDEAITIPAHAPVSIAARNTLAEAALEHLANSARLLDRAAQATREAEKEQRAYNDKMEQVLNHDLEGS